MKSPAPPRWQKFCTSSTPKMSITSAKNLSHVLLENFKIYWREPEQAEDRQIRLAGLACELTKK
jgi:hypothetical protein